MTEFRERFPVPDRATGRRFVQRLRERYREPMVNTPYRLAKTGSRPRK